jgi:NADH-quinone oxidoreductase subunit F
MDDTNKSAPSNGHKYLISVCGGTGCYAYNCREVSAAFERQLKTHNLEKEIAIKTTGCHGFCDRGPIVEIYPDEIFFQRVQPDDVAEIVSRLLDGTKIVDRLLYIDPATQEKITYIKDVPFYKKQHRIILGSNGKIDPCAIDDYIGLGGYDALKKALYKMKPQDIIGEIKKSGLRGRGGAGFPTGIKWEICSRSKDSPKYIVCNGDEGDPGAYMDRSVLEGNPHSVLEGMAIGAYAIGASEGIIYVRTEYPLAIQNLDLAIGQAESRNLLGSNILGSGFTFTVRLCQGAGAFVCGEETALIASVEGERAPEPRIRPPYPAESGLWEKPTNINNVETWANVPTIITKGADWYSRIGTEKSKGTKIFSLVGKINNTGLVEVPMGIKLSEIIYEIGGGIPGNKRFKAVQTGGPSGGCIPASLLDLPVDYERLTEAGSMMGSGGMVVMDERTCMVDIAKYFLNFLKDESCGKCTSCREGTQQMYEIIDRITRGGGKEGDLELLENLGHVVKAASMCGLGQTAGNPVLSTLRYFRSEYEAHIKQKRCPAIVCKEIISSPCQHTCPIGTEAQLYIAHVARGEFEKALDVIIRENPMPATVSRICHHPCERTACRAGEIAKPISIRGLKRFVVDWARSSNISFKWPAAGPETGKKVAVIGGGPAGLTTAYYLRLKGHQVTIFEAESKAGGMLYVGIPEYRLPRAVLDFDIENMKKTGIEIRTNVRVGTDLSVDDILKKGYDAVFVGVGAHESMKMGVPGEDLPGVLTGMKFLRAIHTGQKVDLGKKVCVIGGGNSAIDAARVARRMGCEVDIYYRRTRMEMPAFPEEIDGALEEGVRITYLAAPHRITAANGRLVFECSRMKLGEIDSSGRRRPVPIEGSEFTSEFDTIISSISEQPQTGFLGSFVMLTRWGTVDVNGETLQSSKENIFAGGDAIRGPSTAIEAIRDGKRAAESIDAYLRGRTYVPEYAVTQPSVYVEPVVMTEEEMASYQRVTMPSLSAPDRSNNFKEIDTGYTRDMAVRESRRCLRCDLETQKGQEFLKALRSRNDSKTSDR